MKYAINKYTITTIYYIKYMIHIQLVFIYNNITEYIHDIPKPST